MAARHGDAPGAANGFGLHRPKLREAVGKARVRAVGGGGVQNDAFPLAQGGHQLAAGGVGQAEDGGVGPAGHGGAGFKVLTLLLREREERKVLPPGEAIPHPQARGSLVAVDEYVEHYSFPFRSVARAAMGRPKRLMKPAAFF